MFKIRCACGVANKNFHRNIGEFYVDECCKAAGYDDLGNRKSSGTLIQSSTITVETELKPGETQEQAEVRILNELSQKASAADRVLAFLGVNSKKPSKNQMRLMRVDDLKKIATDRGLEVTETMTKAQLTEALLK